MKLLNKALCITAFFAIGSVSAKKIGGASPVVTAPRTPAGRPVAGKPATLPAAGKPANIIATQGASLKPLRDKVLTMDPSDVIDSKTGILSESFIQKMKDEISAFALFIEKTEKLELEMLLSVARDKFARFVGDDKKDQTILSKINAQIDEEVDAFK